MQNFEVQFWDVGGCVGYPLSSKSILKVVSQMMRLCDYATATVLFSYLYIGFLTFLALLKNWFWDDSPCSTYTFNSNHIFGALVRTGEWKYVCTKHSSQILFELSLHLIWTPAKRPYETKWKIWAYLNFMSYFIFYSRFLGNPKW